MRLSLVALTALICVATAPAQNRVWIVDKKGGPGVWRDTFGLSQFVRDGDLILLREGDYRELGLHNKSVTVVHDARTGPVSIKGFAVSGLSATQSVTLQGVRTGSVSIASCKGAVLIDDCEVQSSVSVLASRAVTLTGCTVSAPGHTLDLSKSTVQVHGCSFRPAQYSGGHGALLANESVLFASDSRFAGGDGRSGGVSNGQCYLGPISGGHGVWLWRGTRAELTNCVLSGGKSAAANPPCPGAPGGVPLKNSGGIVKQTTRPARSFHANSPVREGEKLSIEIGGQPGDEAFLLYNVSSGLTVVPGCDATLFPSIGSIGVLYVGRIGTKPAKIEVVVQPMAAARNFHSLFAQSLLLPKNGCVLTAPRAIVLLDKGY